MHHLTRVCIYRYHNHPPTPTTRGRLSSLTHKLTDIDEQSTTLPQFQHNIIVAMLECR